MKINIEIECMDDDEVLTHLSVIRSKIKKELAKTTENQTGVTFSDSNCYGIHTVKITDL